MRPTAALTVPRAPLQERSRRTLESIARATESLLEERDFDSIAVADIVARARCTTGSFYARFPSKAALLPFLYARYDAELRPRIEGLVRTEAQGRTTLREVVERGVALIVDQYRKRQKLMRALALYVRANPNAVAPDVQRRRTLLHDVPLAAFARFRREIAHDDPDQAVRVGLFIISAAAREKILFAEAPHAAATPLSTEQLKAELSRTLYAYLTTR